MGFNIRGDKSKYLLYPIVLDRQDISFRDLKFFNLANTIPKKFFTNFI